MSFQISAQWTNADARKLEDIHDNSVLTSNKQEMKRIVSLLDVLSLHLHFVRLYANVDTTATVTPLQG